jgi:hypothetical protein
MDLDAILQRGVTSKDGCSSEGKKAKERKDERYPQDGWRGPLPKIFIKLWVNLRSFRQ